MTANDIERVTVAPVEVVDTVGAGDTFMATLLYLLGRDGDPSAATEALDSTGLSRIIDICARAASLTCTRRGADLPRLADIRPFLQD